MRTTQKKRQFSTLNWTNIISRGIRTVQPYCSFGFKRHSVKTIGSKSSAPLFQCEGYCLFQDCPVKVKVKILDDSTLRAGVLFEGGGVCHKKTEIKARPIRADDRRTYAAVLNFKMPRQVYLSKLNELEQDVFEAGCRDKAPPCGVLKTISWEVKRNTWLDENEMTSLQIMLDQQKQNDDKILQKVLLEPKGVMLWSKRSMAVFAERAKEDIVYLDATGSILKKSTGESGPYYIYEIVVRNPTKGRSPLPVATFVTCEHTTASLSFFLGSFMTDCTRSYGPNIRKRPVMFICDGSIVLMQAIAYNLCGLSLSQLNTQYYRIVIGQATEVACRLPILHRCLSHVMKNAQTFSKKHAPQLYQLSMHLLGTMTQASSLHQLDDIVTSAAVVFSSPCNGTNVNLHFHKLQNLMMASKNEDAEINEMEEDILDDIFLEPFHVHFQNIIQNAPLDQEGEANVYHCPDYMAKLLRHFLPYAALWSGMLLGNLGRHGSGPIYELLSNKFCKASEKDTQNYTRDNRTQGIMEKSQWDLKRVRFCGKKVGRMDEFVQQHMQMHSALLREYDDSLKISKKRHRVEEEVWKDKGQKTKRRTGLYVKPLSSPFQNVHEKQEKQTLSQSPLCTHQTDTHSSPVSSEPRPTSFRIQQPETSAPPMSTELACLWQKKSTEVVVASIPTQIRGSNMLIRHSEILSLRPHHWLTGEVIEGLFHQSSNEFKTTNSVYVLNHYTAGVILHGDRTELSRHRLSKYIVPAISSVFLVDPAQNPSEAEQSEKAAKKVQDYFKMRKTFGLHDWSTPKWKGATMPHPVQQDSDSCGVVVTLIARELMRCFPLLPQMTFGTSRNEMAAVRQKLAETLLSDSVFDCDSNCAMCSLSTPPGSSAPVTNWIQCDICGRWYHSQCLDMDQVSFQEAESGDWLCIMCI
ncbi:uncharacterized protein LOC112142033 isoform X2 [Oryzias melastigma]|uniref:uncharacterized protein LOC112142033 isoform X2 n=1 Tax=Oryzias melastigma TaxID=30732 RepID=UPI000CF7F80B|nr:uncharacterized protein LOC112142033 isoform X2 [Oryzias melastigma]